MATLPGKFPLVIDQNTDFVLPMRYLAATRPAPPYAASTPYTNGNYVKPLLDNGVTYLVVGAGTSGAEPAWPTTAGATVSSGGATFMAVGDRRLVDTSNDYGQLVIRDRIGGSVQLFCSTANGMLQVGYDPPTLQFSAAYALGQRVVPRTINGWLYEVVAAGTSGAASPAWGTQEGGTTTSGSVVFRNVGPDAFVSNLRLALTPDDTIGLADWGHGVYEFLLKDRFGNAQSLLYDTAVMRRDLIGF